MSIPANQLDPRAVKIWGMVGLCIWLVLLIVSIVAIGIILYLSWLPWLWPVYVFAFLYLGAGLILIFYLPVIRWRIFRYEVLQDQIEIRSGIFFVKWTSVPMRRIQHITIRQNPIYRRYGLAVIRVYTAGGIFFTIPAIPLGEAEQIKESIVRWIKVKEIDDEGYRL